MTLDVARYLDRLAYEGPTDPTIETLRALHRAHLVAVPFENLDVFNGIPVEVGVDWAIAKVVDRRRGGWCFELNVAFGALLDALGFEVRRLGAAVLLAGPTTVVDHLCLEVLLDEPWLVDVGFGALFVEPIRLDVAGPQPDDGDEFELLGSPQGTTLARLDDGVPQALYRLKRVALGLDDLRPASERLQADRSLHWHQRPMASRLLGAADGGVGADRVTLSGAELVVRRGGERTVTEIDPDDWPDRCEEWFGFRFRPRHW